MKASNRRSLIFPGLKDKNIHDEYGIKVGEWSHDTVEHKIEKVLSFDVTGKIDGNGKYQVTFDYTTGVSRLDMTKVLLKKNDILLTKDVHKGYAGSSSVANQYFLDVEDYETGAAFTIQCSVFADHNKNSNGFIYMKKL
jgi:hexosaminidase